jgi:hypothetical protein
LIFARSQSFTKTCISTFFRLGQLCYEFIHIWLKIDRKIDNSIWMIELAAFSSGEVVHLFIINSHRNPPPLIVAVLIVKDGQLAWIAKGVCCPTKIEPVLLDIASFFLWIPVEIMAHRLSYIATGRDARSIMPQKQKRNECRVAPPHSFHLGVFTSIERKPASDSNCQLNIYN